MHQGGSESRTMHSVHPPLIADEPPSPYFPYWLAIGTLTLAGLSVVLPIVVDSSFPSVAILLCAAVSATCLYLIRAQQPGDQGFMRIGFHIGIVAFFLLMPM